MLFLPSKACVSYAVNNNYGTSEQLLVKNLKRAFLDKKSWPASVAFSPTGRWNTLGTGWELWASPFLRQQSKPESAVEQELGSCARKWAVSVEPWTSEVSKPPPWWQTRGDTRPTEPQQRRPGCSPLLQGALELRQAGQGKCKDLQRGQ